MRCWERRSCPRWLTMTATFLLIVWIVCNGLEDIARFSTLLAPLIILVLILIILGNVQAMQVVNVLPFGGSSWPDRLKTAQLVLLIFLPVCTLLVLYLGCWSRTRSGGWRRFLSSSAGSIRL